MKNFRESFEQTYGFDAIEFIREIGNEYFGILKSIGINSAIDSYAEKKGYKIPNNRREVEQYNKFQIALLEAMQQEGAKFPENQKLTLEQETNSKFQITPLNPSVPKSKGVLEDFKNIVGSDVFRPSMNGVFVDNDVLVATDAHKLVVFENDDFKEHNLKIIDLTTYLGTKGAKFAFVDATFPKYEQILPTNYEQKIKDFPIYALYNFAQSAIAMKKLQTSDVFACRLMFGDTPIAFNPIILSELTGFMLAKGIDTCTIEYDTPNKAVLLKTDSKNLGLIMPLYSSGQDELISTVVYTTDELKSAFNEVKIPAKKALKTKVATPKKTVKALTYTKFTGKIADTVYIPRRDIVSILLKNGEEIAGNEIVDGVYKMK
jgi:hypothetical protein